MPNQKTVLITGASSGIGLSMARMLSQNGYRCLLVARRELLLKKISSDLVAGSENHLYFSCDLANAESIFNMFRYIEKEDIKLSGFVHCAGVAPIMNLPENDYTIMQNTFAVNVMSFIEISKYFLMDKYSEDGSSIVAISSIAALTSTIRQCVYSSSKAALNCSVRHIAKNGLSRKIRSNAIMPGVVNTDMVKNMTNDNDALLKQYPLGLIETDEIAESVLYLLSEKSKHITGSIISIDSGFMLR